MGTKVAVPLRGYHGERDPVKWRFSEGEVLLFPMLIPDTYRYSFAFMMSPIGPYF
jgi:hypothetical protein